MSFNISPDSSRIFARNFPDDQDISTSATTKMEDKTVSATASIANDSGYVQHGSEQDSFTIDAGGQSNVRIVKSNVVSYPAASWLEFTEWLERGLDEYGLEPTLYARCVLSILKQPPETATDLSGEHGEEWAASFLSVATHHHGIGRNMSAPSSRKNSFGSLASAAAAAAASAVSNAVKCDADTRKQALMDCLKTMNGDEAGLGKFIDDIVNRYSLVSKAGVLGEKQNESVDSGVCPSPEESFQNYDEAFPPLATDRSFDGSTTDVFVGESVAMRPRVASSSWLSGKRPAVTIGCDLPAPIDNNESKMVDDQDVSGRAQGDGSPVKRPKLLMDSLENEIGCRALHSCPDFVNTPSATAPVCSGKRATFCCPVVKKQSSIPQPSASVKIPPQFIIPKFWKVGSWPSRYDRSTKPAADVPFWSCSEWFCTVHKRLEFGLLNAKINGDTKSLAASSAPPTATAASCCGNGNDQTTSVVNVDAGNQMDVEIFEIEPPLPPPPQQPPPAQQQLWSLGENEQEQVQPLQQQAQVVPEMFDAPRFILHIINEDDTLGKESFFPTSKQNASQSIKNASPLSSDWASFFDLGAADDMLFTATQKMSDAQYGHDNNSPWAAPLPPPPPVAQSEFSIDQMDESGNVDIVSSAGILLPVDVSHLANSAVGFCLPKCVSSIMQQQQLLQQQQRQQFLMPPPISAAGVFNKQAMEGVLTSEPVNSKQPQSVAVPIRDSTHFRPIRSESMEDAYFLKPGFDEFGAAIENIDEYHVYQYKEEAGSNIITTVAPSTNLQHQARRSLPLKFRALKPNKMCQTEEFDTILANGEETNDDVTLLLERYRQEFEIWAFQPSAMSNCLHMSKWDLNESSDSNEAMIVGPLSPHIDDGWLDELVNDEQPPPMPLTMTSRRDEHAIRPAPAVIGYAPGLIDKVVYPKQQQHEAPKKMVDGQQQLDIWQQEDERYEDSLLRYVSNISLISPLDIQTTTV